MARNKALLARRQTLPGRAQDGTRATGAIEDSISIFASAIDAVVADLAAHVADTSNPHMVTAAQVGAPTAGLLPYFDLDNGMHGAAVVDWTPTSAELTGQRNSAFAGTLRTTDANTQRQHGITGAIYDTSTGVGNGHLRGVMGTVELLSTGTHSGQNMGVYGGVDVLDGLATIIDGLHSEIFVDTPGQAGTIHGVYSLIEVDGASTTVYNYYASNVAGGITNFAYYINQIHGTTQWGFYNAQGALRSFTAGSWIFAEQADDPAPDADQASVYARDDGSGNTQLVAQFSDGSIRALATQDGVFDATAYFVNGNPGIDATVDAAALATMTMTFEKGILTGFA